LGREAATVFSPDDVENDLTAVRANLVLSWFDTLTEDCSPHANVVVIEAAAAAGANRVAERAKNIMVDRSEGRRKEQKLWCVNPNNGSNQRVENAGPQAEV
jgi:hypothetical protein